MAIDCRVYRIINIDRYPAAFVPAWDRPQPGEEDGTDEAIANAHLIAAAPEMFEALPDLSFVITWLKNGCDPMKAVDELLIYERRILDAKAKAKGYPNPAREA